MAAGANPRQPPAVQASEQAWNRYRGGEAETGRASWYIECHTEAGWPQEGEMRMAVVGYMVVIERGGTSWGDHVPDLTGCGAGGATRTEAVPHIRDATGIAIS